MTLNALVVKYDRIAAPICRTRRKAPEGFAFTDRLIQVEHARWMLTQIPELPRDKAIRWICFVQGVLWGKGLISVADCRADISKLID